MADGGRGLVDLWRAAGPAAGVSAMGPIALQGKRGVRAKGEGRRAKG